MTPEEVLKRYQKEYDEEYKVKRLNIVTTEMDGRDDGCGGQKKKTVMKYYTVRDKEYYTKRGYDECDGTVLQKDEIEIPPRKFYTESEVRNYARYINKIAGRTLEDDEMNLLLKTISRGRQYRLTIVKDITKELKGQTIWVE